MNETQAPEIEKITMAEFDEQKAAFEAAIRECVVPQLARRFAIYKHMDWTDQDAFAETLADFGLHLYCILDGSGRRANK